ncbi:MAG: ThiF family adenylyltransferase [Patescibacteria group bacterium]
MDNQSRQANLVGDFRKKSVGIIGLGMHGSWTALAVARLGVGLLTVWDDDYVSEGNLDNQFYSLSYVGRLKEDALGTMLIDDFIRYLLLYRPSGRFQNCEEVKRGVSATDVLICCADSFDTRKLAATMARDCGVKLLIESRSAKHTAFIHALRPTKEKVASYIESCFPSVVEEATCGDTGTTAMGMAIASQIAAHVINSSCGSHPELIPEETTIRLGYSMSTKMIIFGVQEEN